LWKKLKIYGVKLNDEFKYIGKTSKKLVKSSISRTNKNMDEIYVNQKDKLKIVGICDTNDKWYDDKLREILCHNEHPLVNPQWMLMGKRSYWQGTSGYWHGKKRDPNTIEKLNKSKYKKVLQYDKHGKYIKTWDSAKDVSIRVFGDYDVNKKSRIYGLLKNNTIKNKFACGSYWIYEEEILKYFVRIPVKLNINAIVNREKQKHSEAVKKSRKNIDHSKIMSAQYTVIHINPDATVKCIYDNVKECAYKLKLSISTVKRLCNENNIRHPDYILKYGAKKKQLSIEYPKYKTQRIKHDNH
jgi:hypothetical protein